MIKKLQYRFISITTFSIAMVMMVLLAVLNIYNYGATYNEAYRVLRFIADNEGEIGSPDREINVGPLTDDEPDDETEGSPSDSRKPADAISDINQYVSGLLSGSGLIDLTGEASYMIRYYSVTFDRDKNVVKVNTDHIASINSHDAVEQATELLSRPLHRGHFSDGMHVYTFMNRRTADKGRIVVVMDSTRDLDDATSVIRRSFLLGVFCLIIFVVVIIFLSKKAMMPVIRNIENQKAFITNAGHELKTPLAVIKADTEVLEMSSGENEWTRSIRNQVDRLTVLVGNLITLAKMGELDKESLSDIDFSECVQNSADNYKVIITNQGKTLNMEITPKVIVKGTKDALTEIVNILLDNAQKYCDEKGSINIELTHTRRNSGAKLVISNDYADGKNVDYTKFFDRFYRGDTSHSTSGEKNSGYGIGLSMAEGFVNEFGGKIAAEYHDGRISFIIIF
ncbi:MAG: HAMP domain-containing histidine kinase [Lachnospiraceae bacterium]|nr:HAMP domain-containing histidine kinase [Lachnospiraceae bacterium]